MDVGGEFYRQIPKDYWKHMAFREDLLTSCHRSVHMQNAVREKCKNDVLFFLASMTWLYEPRVLDDADGTEKPQVIPFIPWDHQEVAVKQIAEVLGRKDIAVYKSRGEGLSWIACLFALHDWLFNDMAKIGLVSDTADKADNPNNMDSLLQKIVWELSRLPKWLVGEEDKDWRRLIATHSLVNLRNGSQINAFAATAETGRAGRYKWFLCDELAFWESGKDRRFMESIRASTNCRLAISTPNGSSGAFYDMVHVPSGATEKVRIHWTQNNFRSRGLYTLVDGRPKPMDPRGNPIPLSYIEMTEDVQNLFSRLRSKGFRLEGRIRSPWYDNECDKGDATPQSIAQEYDLDFGGSAYRVFSPEFNEKARDTIVRPVSQGIVDFNMETLEAEYSPRTDAGECKLWVELDASGKPPLSTYVVGCDISSGLGGSYTSNSVCEVIDRITGEQVLEWSSNMIEPVEFARLCVVISKWFYDAYLGWEANFGGGFTKTVSDLGYANIYYRTRHWVKGRRKQKEIGWWTDDRSKELMFSYLHSQVRNGSVTIRGEDLLRECGEYIRSGPQSAIVHEGSIDTTDKSSKGKAHGDRVIAFAIAVQLLHDRPVIEKPMESDMQSEPHPNTLAWRVAQWEKLDAKADEWDDSTLSDIGYGMRNGF